VLYRGCGREPASGGADSSRNLQDFSVLDLPRGVSRIRSLRAVAAAGLAVALLGSAAARAEFFEGRVVRVFDGDTLELRVGAETRRIRLAGIDAPERGQPWAERARQALSRRVSGRDVRVNAVDVDRHGRLVGEVYADGVCVGCELVREGHVWVYRRYTDDPVLISLEAEARAARRGLWGLPEAQIVPPWEWRHGESGHSPEAPGSGAARPAECEHRVSCAELASCAEARRRLEACGPEGLDGDRDGIPCESLCSR
jgi:endonuclease YncB( thermonuclease family)